MQCGCVFSCVWLFVTLWTVSCQTPLSMEFSRQVFWSGLPIPTPGDLPDPSPASPALAGGFFTTCVTWEALLSSSSWDVLKPPCWVRLLIWAGITGLNFPLRLRPCAHKFYLYRSKHLDHFVTLGWSLEVIVYVRSTYQILLEKGLCFNFMISQREQLAYF